MLAHICNRFKGKGESLMPKELKAELSREYSAFEDNQKRTIKLLRRMLIAQKLNQNPPTREELSHKQNDFFKLIIPALN